MRTITKSLLVVVLFMQIQFAYANVSIFSNKKDSVVYLEIRGRAIIREKMKDDVYKVQLMENNKVIDSVLESDNEMFSFGLQKNCFYSLKIYKKGYLSKLIVINTYIPESKYLKDYFIFEFETELINIVEEEKLDQDTKDFPIAIIQFDKLKQGFDYNQLYTYNIKKDLYKQEIISNNK